MTVTVTDSFGATDSVAVTINVVDVREAGVLGRIVITVGSSGGNYGYDSGSYGTLDSGDFPGDLFDDGNDRTPAEIYEDADGHWYFTYSGGLADDWQSDDEQLNEITIDVFYEDEKDNRSFVLASFIDSRPGSRGLKLDPPIPSTDWASRNGEEVAFEFRRHQSQTQTAVTPAALVDPPTTAGSWTDFLVSTTPGGPVVMQTLIVIIVYTVYLFTAKSTAWSVPMAAIVLVMTPVVPVIFGFGDPLAAAGTLFNVVVGTYSYKMLGASTEG